MVQRHTTCADFDKAEFDQTYHSRAIPTRYHKISHNPMVIKNFLVDLFVEAHERAPRRLFLTYATDDPLPGNRWGGTTTVTTTATATWRSTWAAAATPLVAKLRSAWTRPPRRLPVRTGQNERRLIAEITTELHMVAAKS